MISLSEYYEKNLYPLQDGVLNAVSRCGTRFFLTGGTALSRGYYNHRYSDDLDFFVNGDAEYAAQLDAVLDQLLIDGFFWDSEKGFFRTENFCSVQVGWDKSAILLKLDFVNDIAPYFGDLVSTAVFNRTDSVRNILSNKITALFRYESKDVADIREIAFHEPFDWSTVIYEARQKESGIEIPVVCEILKGMPEEEFDTIRWIDKPGWKSFCNDIEIITYDMMTGGLNTLCKG